MRNILNNLISLASDLENVESMTAHVGEWTVEIENESWRSDPDANERKITISRLLHKPEPEAIPLDDEEGAADDLPFC